MSAITGTSGISEQQITDWINLTMGNDALMGVTNYVEDIQEHILLKDMFSGAVQNEGGTRDFVNFRAMIDHNHSGAVAKLYQPNSYIQRTKTIPAQIGARMFKDHFFLDSREESTQNKRSVMKRSVIERVAMELSWAAMMSEQFWGKPEDATDEESIYGIPYWITASATEGFYGMNPSGFTAGKAGIDATAYDKARNWTAHAAAVSEEDFLAKVRKCARNIHFVSVVDFKSPGFNGKRRMYCSEDLIDPFTALLKDMNQNVGTKFGFNEAIPTFGSVPVLWDANLDKRLVAESDPLQYLYLVDGNSLKYTYLEGFKEHYLPAKPVDDMDYTFRVRKDTIGNVVCTDLRKQGVITL